MSGCISNQVNRLVNTEGGRIALLLEDARQCAARNALQKARGSRPCVSTQSASNAARSSDLTASRTACMTYVSPNTCVPEGTWIARRQAAVIEASRDPADPSTRFASYSRPIPPPVCQAIPQEALNANVPKNQMRRCPLLNRPDLIVLPG